MRRPGPPTTYRRAKRFGKEEHLAAAPRYDGLSAELEVATAARVFGRALFAALGSELAGVLAGDPRAVHDARVSIRRLRASLRSYGAALERHAIRARRKELKRLAGRLGDVRDLDVALGRLRAALAGATEAERPGIAAAIELLLVRRRRALTRFALELGSFDRARLRRTFDDA